MKLYIIAQGRPIPQGSVRSLGKGRPSIHGNAARLLPWRDTLISATQSAMALDGWDRMTSPVHVEAVFHFHRPQSHYRTGKNAHLLRDKAPAYPCTRAQGDADKLLRGLLDALVQAGCLADDCQVIDALVRKRWVGPEMPNNGVRAEVVAA